MRRPAAAQRQSARSPTRRRRRAALSLSIAAVGKAGSQHIAYLNSRLRAAHEFIRNSPLRELSVALVGDRQMSALHRRFMGIDGPTDVLTFPLDMDSKDRPRSGEVVVCVSEARRRARELGMDLRRELLLYCLHGMLHLCGMDDRTAAQYRRMHRMEDLILRRLGVGPVFAVASARKRT